MKQTEPHISQKTEAQKKTCFHCGEVCPNSKISIGDKYFCCNGCKLVYEILDANDMCTYYSIDENPGNSPQEAGHATKFQYLDDPDIQRKIVNFSDGETATLTLYIPPMHCASCVWLLESLYKFDPGVAHSQVNFLKKELSLSFKEKQTSIRKIVELLASIGYEPQINLDSLQEKIDKDGSKDLYIKLGVAGFCFANIMLFSFPEYLTGGGAVGPGFKKFFGALNILLSLPVFFYSAQGYFQSAIKGWKQRYVNMDVPISIGIIALFVRSLIEIISGSGSGYMDSFAGLVFLLLLGKLFEKKTYDTLSFERDYKSYFPVSVTKKENNTEKVIPLEKLKVKDRIILRNHELVPADAVLINGTAYIDYSFVTGESSPVEKQSGDIIFAGGKQIGGSIELDVIKEVNQSYLTQLWNEEAFSKEHASRLTTVANSISKYFTIIVLSVAAISAIYWSRTNITLALNAFTSVLIVACPCALALSTPFTLGNTLRIFGKNNFYLKNTSVIEALAKITTVVFDKTGTITRSNVSQINFVPNEKQTDLSENELELVYSTAKQSGHPLSQLLTLNLKSTERKVDDFVEYPGKGVRAWINGVEVKLGSHKFIETKTEDQKHQTTQVYVSINGQVRGFFQIANVYREGLSKIITNLDKKFDIKLITGDGENEKENLLKYFQNAKDLLFRQMPIDKLNFIKALQSDKKQVMMIGDGLNDAGALKQSDVGVSISEDINTFSPASDAILDAKQFTRLDDFIHFSKTSMKIIISSFIISFIYNFVGLSFAISGTLSPLIAAILMPLSSITVIVFTTGMTTLFAKKRGLL